MPTPETPQTVPRSHSTGLKAGPSVPLTCTVQLHLSPLLIGPMAYLPCTTTPAMTLACTTMPYLPSYLPSCLPSYLPSYLPLHWRVPQLICGTSVTPLLQCVTLTLTLILIGRLRACSGRGDTHSCQLGMVSSFAHLSVPILINVQHPCYCSVPAGAARASGGMWSSGAAANRSRRRGEGYG